MTLSIVGLTVTLSIMTLPIVEIIVTFRKKKFSIMTPSISKYMLSDAFSNCYAECRYAECRYAECRGATI